MSEEKDNEILQIIQEQINCDVPIHKIVEFIYKHSNGTIKINHLFIQKLQLIENHQNK